MYHLRCLAIGGYQRNKPIVVVRYWMSVLLRSLSCTAAAVIAGPDSLNSSPVNITVNIFWTI